MHNKEDPFQESGTDEQVVLTAILAGLQGCMAVGNTTITLQRHSTVAL
jgi:hypothetical protein